MSQSEKQSQSEENPEEKKDNELDTLVSHLQEVEGISEDTAELIANNWQKLIGFAVIMLFSIWVFKGYQTRQSDKQADASKLFINLQEQYNSLSEGYSDDKVLQISNTLKALREGHTNSSYADGSEIYIRLLSVNKDVLKSPDARAALEKLSQAPLDEGSVEEVLSSLVNARKNISENNFEEARKLLISTVEKGNLASVEAAIILRRISKTSDEKEQAKKLELGLIARRPEFSDLLKP